jgi:hypothetical protein
MGVKEARPISSQSRNGACQRAADLAVRSADRQVGAVAGKATANAIASSALVILVE